MRNTDPDPQPFRPLGEKVVRPSAPAPAPQKPQGPSGIVYDKDGRPSTTSHKPHVGLTLDEAIWNWHEHYAADSYLDFLP